AKPAGAFTCDLSHACKLLLRTQGQPNSAPVDQRIQLDRPELIATHWERDVPDRWIENLFAVLPDGSGHNRNHRDDVTSKSDKRCVMLPSQSQRRGSALTRKTPNLAAVMAAWPKLPEAIR